jgi:hypothetical protein
MAWDRIDEVVRGLEPVEEPPRAALRLIVDNTPVRP